MNSDSVDRQWQYLRGELKAWWDQLTDADLEQVAGKKAQLVALVQERYGYTRERAQQEVERRLQEYQTSVSQLVGTLTDTAQEVASSLAETAGDVAADGRGHSGRRASVPPGDACTRAPGDLGGGDSPLPDSGGAHGAGYRRAAGPKPQEGPHSLEVVAHVSTASAVSLC
jgi:uncharacterized protein YjbJ (UPF0337 family)